jgi:hypothetical protein
MSVTVRIVEPGAGKPGAGPWSFWYLIPFVRRRCDAQVQIDFDGTPVGNGSYMDGVAVTVHTTLGSHELSYRCDPPVVAPLRRKREDTIRVEVPEPGVYEYRLGLWTPVEPGLSRAG